MNIFHKFFVREKKAPWRSLFVLVCLLELAIVRPVFAAACVPIPSALDQELGTVPLGQKVDIATESNARLTRCASEGACAFTDGDGVEYAGDGGATVEVKSMSFEQAGTKTLPFDLSRGDSIVAVMRKLFARHKEWVSLRHGAEDGFILLSEPCFKNTQEIVFAVGVVFDAQGQVLGVSLVTARAHAGLREFADLLLRR